MNKPIPIYANAFEIVGHDGAVHFNFLYYAPRIVKKKPSVQSPDTVAAMVVPASMIGDLRNVLNTHFKEGSKNEIQLHSSSEA